MTKVCRRGARQEMYAQTSTPVREVMHAALLHEEQAKAVKNNKQHRHADMSPVDDLAPKSLPAGRKVWWGGLRQLVNMGAKLGKGSGAKKTDMSEHGVDLSRHGDAVTDASAHSR